MDVLCHPIMGDSDYWFQDGGRLSPFATATQSVLALAGIIQSPASLNSSTRTPGDAVQPSFLQPPRLQGRGIYLWSVGIAFDHPATGIRIDLSIEEPESYKQLRADLLG